MSAPASGDAALSAARELHRHGQFDAAIEGYRRILDADGSRPEIWHYKAMAEHQAGHLEAARESVARAIAEGGGEPQLLLLEGYLLQDGGQRAEAEERFRQVAAARPDWAPGHLALGEVLMDLARPAEALDAFRTAAAADASNAAAWNNIGIALKALQRPDEATQAFLRALELRPGHALANLNLARLHNFVDPAAALAHAQAAVNADARLVEAWLLIGDLHRRAFQPAQALAAIDTAIRLVPRGPAAWIARAGVVAELGEVVQARAEFGAVARSYPESFQAALGANLLLPRVYESAAHLEASRDEYAAGLERLGEAAGRFRFPNREAALAESAWSNFYLAYQGRNDRDLQAAYGRMQRAVLQPVLPDLFEPRRRRAGGDRVRVGFLSHFFFNCVAGRYFSSWVTHLDAKRFETFVYYTNHLMANDTRAIAAAAGTFRHMAGKPLEAIARQVIDDGLDILVYPEVGMYPNTATLAALRLAPAQCAAWGHPTTTGLPEIDWCLSCAEMEPNGAGAHYTERLATLPGLGTRYALPQASQGASRADMGLPDGRTLYLVPQSLFKIHPDNDALIAEVLARDPDGVAVMFASNHARLSRTFEARLARSLSERGIDIAGRVRFLEPSLQHADYLRLNQLCDVMLDTLHWSGGNTSLDAFASGLPLVTLPGELMRGRQSRAMLRMMNLDELIARNPDDYVDKAIELGTDPGLRRSVSERIAERRGAIFERDEPIRALEDFLERAARGA
jgi:CRISPR-associated protein Csy1